MRSGGGGGAAVALLLMQRRLRHPGESATSFLLRLLTLEIARDGGACLVTRLKDYVQDVHNVSSKRLNALLVESNVGKPRLMAFLESHADVFQVDRNDEPHWVTLFLPKDEHNNSTSTNGTTTLLQQQDDNNLTPDSDTSAAAAAALQTALQLKSKAGEKALRILRKRHARMVRRQQQQQQQQLPPNDNNENNIKLCSPDYNLLDDHGVYNHWLLRQCYWEVHVYLRATGFYQKVYPTPQHVQIVSSREWERIVMPTFLKEIVTPSPEMELCDNDTKIRLQLLLPPLPQHCGESDSVDGLLLYGAEGNEERAICMEIDRMLTELVVHKDGGHQISLSLLLHRHPAFRDLLGGRDLWQMYNRSIHPENDDDDNERTKLFQEVDMFVLDNGVILRSRRTKTSVPGNGSTTKDDTLTRSNVEWSKRMKVDEEGLFSVTNRKWGRVMSNLLIQACRSTKLFEDELNLNSNPAERQPRVVVDLTASVGGMTLALAKSKYFDRVLAYEIDETRAALCAENMEEHGYGDAVEIFNQDSVDSIPKLPRNMCLVIDPPWGGYNYKRLSKGTNGRAPLMLGETALEDVLANISLHNSPCVIGLRLPVNYAIDDLLDALSSKNGRTVFAVVLIRKIAVQLFAVLSFPDSSIQTTAHE